jgi:hypothetical protein
MKDNLYQFSWNFRLSPIVTRALSSPAPAAMRRKTGIAVTAKR